MKIVSIFTSDPEKRDFSDEMVEKMGAFIQELTAKGALVDTGGALDEGFNARLIRHGDNIRVTDGPFTESKEVVGGFALFEVESKKEALDIAHRFLEIAGEGTCDLHEVGATPKFEA